MVNLTCEHEDFESDGKFPDNITVEGEFLVGGIVCTNCGKLGREYYEYTGDRLWSKIEKDNVEEK